MQRALRAAVLLLPFALGASASAQSLSCAVPQKQQLVAQLLFGRKIGDRVAVSETQWTHFLDREITPRFPDGLTVTNAQGQWRDPDRNRIVREPSKVVQVVLPGRDGDQDRLNEIAEAYKKKFRQQSVGLIVRPACVAF